MNDYDDKLDQDVDSIISQLKNQSSGLGLTRVKKERPELTKENMEKFIIDNASSVISDCVDMMQELTEIIKLGPDYKMVESVAELAKATTSAIDALSKLKLSDDKIKGQKDIKQMDIDSKSSVVEEKQQGGLYLSREELIKSLRSYKELPTPEPITIDV